MFLCDKCATKNKVSEFEILFGSRSRGPCEGCGEVASCVDAHFSHSEQYPVDDKSEEGDMASSS